MSTLRIFFVCVALFSFILWLAESIEQRARMGENRVYVNRSTYEPAIMRPIWWAALAIVSVCAAYALS